MLHTRPLKRRRSIDDGLWSMRQATCHSHRGTSLTHSIQQTIRSMSTDAVPPPCKTNYLSILYCQVLHALFMQATISETVNKKDGGVTLDGRELPGSERWSLMKLDCIRSKSKPEAQWWGRICDSPSSKLGIFHGTTIWDVLFLWVSQVKSVRGAKVLCSMASISQKCNSGGSLYHFCMHN